MLTRKVSFLGLISVFLAGTAPGGEAIPNWRAPATWSPARSRGVGAMDITNPLPFIGLAPCRIVDTRGNGAPITGGMFTGGSDVRSYAVAGFCGIPTSARALSLNFTVTGPGQTGAGFLTAWPTGGAVPPVSILNWDHVPAQIANAAVVPTNTSTSFTVNVSAPTHVIIDVNGYYCDGSALLAPGEQFVINGSSDFTMITAVNFSPGSGYGIQGIAFGTSGNGIFGGALATTGVVFGVLAHSESASDGAAGLLGQALSSTGATHGVRGRTFSAKGGGAGISGGSAAGVAGVELSGFPAGSSNLAAGVLGASKTRVGVQGDSGSVGVRGDSYDSAGNIVTVGLLGFNGGFGGPYGVFSTGNFTATGTKMFIEPHATDPSKVVRFVSLEGNESGTYFRGSAHIVNGTAVIPVPEEFRMVTDEDGLTVQLTPVGAAASMFVVSEDLRQIVVRSNRDVKFHYQVNGIRRAFKDYVPIVQGLEFMPYSPSAGPLGSYPAEIRQRLVANGTYNPDGSVNLETAERLGWTKVSQESEEQASPAAAAPTQPRIPPIVGENRQSLAESMADDK